MRTLPGEPETAAVGTAVSDAAGDSWSLSTGGRGGGLGTSGGRGLARGLAANRALQKLDLGGHLIRNGGCIALAMALELRGVRMREVGVHDVHLSVCVCVCACALMVGSIFFCERGGEGFVVGSKGVVCARTHALSLVLGVSQ